jgi:ABC-type multidrug transport system permease subunit
MKRVREIGHNDLRLFLREPTSYIWLIAIPLAFTYFMGFASRAPGEPTSLRPAVVLESQDAGFLGRVLREELGEQGLRLVSATNCDEAKRGIRIPADFTQRILERRPAKVEFFKLEGSDDATAALVELRLVRALIALNAYLVEHAASSAGQPPSEAGLRVLMDRPEPVSLQARFAGRKPMPTGFSLSLPGNLVSYLMLNLLIFGGASVAWERRSGVLRRLTIYPVRRAELVFGKIYGLMLLAAVQIAVFLVLGQAALGVNVGDHLGAILLTLGVFAWVSGSFGVLVGFLVQAEEKVIGLCLLLALPMAALGGCWWPLELVPNTVRILAHLVPTGWAMDALHQLISFGGGWAQAREEVAVLVLFGAAANLAALRFFRC